jgi:SAM-dependent methyltransferase
MTTLSQATKIEYRLSDTDGIHYPTVPVSHRGEEYSEASFPILAEMQQRHFWYQGRHRFLLAAFDRAVGGIKRPLKAIDLGGGVGGWIRFLSDRRKDQLYELAIGDSSPLALRMALDVLPGGVDRYQVDLMALGWRERWDVVFLLDVIEHLPDDTRALAEVAAALKPGGIALITTPALTSFWSYNDDAAGHLRRYSRADFIRLSAEAGLELVDARYFMFLLSPLYWAVRKNPAMKNMSSAQKLAALERAHRIPTAPINAALAAVFCLETPLGQLTRFPWGTSVLGVLRKR